MHLSLSRTFGKVSLGTTAGLYLRKFHTYQNTALGFNFGAKYKVNKKFNLALFLENPIVFGLEKEYSIYPFASKLAMEYSIIENWKVTSQVEYHLSQGFNFSTASYVNLLKILTFYTGAVSSYIGAKDNAFANNSKNNILDEWNLGLSVLVKELKISYSHSQSELHGGRDNFGVALDF